MYQIQSLFVLRINRVCVDSLHHRID